MSVSTNTLDQRGRNRYRERIRILMMGLAIAAHLTIAAHAFAQRQGSSMTSSSASLTQQTQSVIQTQAGGMQTMNNHTQNGSNLSGQFGHASGSGPAYFTIVDLNLRVEEGKSDVTPGFLLERNVDIPENFKFKWKNTKDNVIAVQWQVSSVELASENPDMNQPSVLATGWLTHIPGKGEARFFHIDFNSIMPATPPANPVDYFIRVVTLDSNSNVRVPSKSVNLTYQLSNSTTRFTPSGLGMTVKQQGAAMYALSPMPIEVDMQTLYCGNDNESSGDEPYLVAFVVYADGQSIKVFDLPNSTIRIDKKNQLHGNVPDVDNNGNDVEQGSTINIPTSTGLFTNTLTPIGFGEMDDLEDADKRISDAMAEHTKVYIVVIAMEEDASSAASIAAARTAALQTLTNKVNVLIQSMTIPGLTQGNVPDFETELMNLQSSIRDDAVDAAIDAALIPGWWLPGFDIITLAQAIDPDDYVGFDYSAISFGELMDAGPSGVPFELNMANSKDWEGSYRVNGRVRGLNFMFGN